MKKFIFIFLLSTLSLFSNDIPELNHFANDLTKTIKESELDLIDKRLTEISRSQKAQIVVLITNTIGENALEEYSLKVAEKNKIGYKKVDNGVLILIVKDLRKIRIDVGYGLEGQITDVDSKRMIREILAPKLKEGKFSEGIHSTIDRILELIGIEKNESTKPIQESKKNTQTDTLTPEEEKELVKYYPLLFVLVFGFLLHFFTGLFIAGISVSLISLVVAPIFVGSGFFATLVISFVIFFVSIIFNLILANSIGIGGGGSSGGIFSGGGGSFGGGGASGDW
jgi:uncharacterized protein